MAGKESLRSQIIGAWELIAYSAVPATGSSDTIYPMGPDAKGIIIYNPDGYMSAHLLRPGQGQFANGGRDGSEAEWAQVGRNYIAYTGQFYLDESGEEPLLIHSMQVSNLPSLLGDRQRRLMSITKEGGERFLNLAPDREMLGKMGYKEMNVKWRRLPDNPSAKPPETEREA
jgi:hypothetical protein